MANNTSRSDWELVYVLPNLELAPPSEEAQPFLDTASITTLDQQQLFITSSVSKPAKKIRSHFPAAERLLSSFSTPTGRKLNPAILVVASDTPDSLRRDREAAVAFRNAVALHYILHGRARTIAHGHSTGPTWSDTFDFHPTTLGLDGSIMTISPALQAFYVDPESVVAVSSPELPIEGDQLHGDPFLKRTLGAEWRRRFLSPREDDRFGRLLFASLQAAYQASSVAVKNRGSIQEYGLQVAVWVSALEILAQPARGRVGKSQVLDLLENVSWNDLATSARWYVVDQSGKQTARRGNLIQRLYALLYHARNKFIHGERIGATLLTPKVGGTQVILPRAASLIYRAALTAYLNRNYEPADLDQVQVFAAEMMARSTHKDALLQLVGKGKRPML